MATPPIPAAPDYLALPGLVTAGVAARPSRGDGPAVLQIEAVVVRPPTGCPACGGGLHAHDTRALEVADEPRHGRPVRLRVTYRRYRCVACGASCTDVPDILAAGRRMTRRLAAYVEARVGTISIGRLAAETGLAASSVAGLVAARLDALEAACRPRAAAVLGIDEVHLGRAAVGVAGHDRKRGLLVITAPEGNRVLAVGADTRRATVEAELRGLADLDCVTLVTMDMTPHYRDAVRAVLPAATIVADRWHVQKLFVAAAQEARKRFLRTAPAAERPRLKEQHTLVGRRRHALADGERRALDGLLAAAPLLAEAYRLKEGFGAIYDRCHSSSAAIDAYDAWLRSFPSPDDDPDSAASRLARDVGALFAGPIAAVEAWLVEVFAWFDAQAGAHGARPSQGHAENRNRWLKDLYRAGNGLSLATLRRRAVYGAGDRRHLAPREAGDRPAAARCQAA